MSALAAVRIDQNAEDPRARVWAEIPKVPMSLAAAPIASQPSRYIRTAWAARPYGLVRSLSAQAAHDGQRLFVRLEWLSPTSQPSTGAELTGPTSGPDAFPDAVAVIFPEAGGDPDIATKGAPEAPVRIWRWAAEVPGGSSQVVESLSAGGIGSLGQGSEGPPSVDGALRASASGDGERREVVFSRPLGAEDAERPAFEPGQAARIGFAVWVGANQERAGIKSSSAQWSELRLAQ